MHRRVGGAGIMDVLFLMLGAFAGFTMGVLFTVWWYEPSEMDR